MDSSNFDALKLSNQLCFPLYAASREVIKRYRPYLDALNLTYTQYIAMMVLWEEKKINAKELGNRLFLDSGTLTPVLKSMESKGFLTRYRCREDERILMVEITEAGEALKHRAVEIPEKIASCVHLEWEEATEMYRLLYKVLHQISDITE